MNALFSILIKNCFKKLEVSLKKKKIQENFETMSSGFKYFISILSLKNIKKGFVNHLKNNNSNS